MTNSKNPTSGGVELTDELLDRLAEEAEEGYDVERLRPRQRRGRPPMGAKAASLFQVRLEPELHDALKHTAKLEHTSPSEVARTALREYIQNSTQRRKQERAFRGGIFISYRVQDAPLGASAVANTLTSRYGSEYVFHDPLSIKREIHLWDDVRKALERTAVFIIVVSAIRDDDTGSAQKSFATRYRDWLNREIAQAAERHVPVIPVLLTDNSVEFEFHQARSIARHIRKLASHKALTVSRQRFGADMKRLANTLEDIVPSLTAKQLFVTLPQSWDRDCAPSTILRPEYEIVPFQGREGEIAELQAWASAPAGHSVRFLVGHAGSGKSRLALELCRRLAAEGWSAGFLRNRVSKSRLVEAIHSTKPLLIAVDNAESKLEELTILGNALSDRAVGAPPVRLLLLGRSFDNSRSLKYTPRRSSQLIDFLRRTTEISTIILDDGKVDRSAQFHAARAAFINALNIPEPGEVSHWEPDRYDSLLEVHAAALSSLFSITGREEGLASRQTSHPFSRLQAIELEHWRSWSRAKGVNLNLKYLVTAGTLATLGHPTSETQTRELLTNLQHFHGEDAYPVETYVDALKNLYMSRHDLESIQPDLFGEQVVALTLIEQPPVILTLAATFSDGQIVNALIVLGRALSRYPELNTVISDLIRADPIRIAMLCADAVPLLEDPRPFVYALKSAVSDVQLDDKLLSGLLRRIGR